MKYLIIILFMGLFVIGFNDAFAISHGMPFASATLEFVVDSTNGGTGIFEFTLQGGGYFDKSISIDTSRSNVSPIIDVTNTQLFIKYGSIPSDFIAKHFVCNAIDQIRYHPHFIVVTAQINENIICTLTVESTAPPTGKKPIQNSDDDAIELILSGVVDADYDLIEFDKDYISGFRFNDIQLDGTQTIKRAYINFTASNPDTEEVMIEVFGELDINSKAFIETNSNISNRQTTTNSILWNVPAWENNMKASTPDLTNIINEIINQSGWSSGNSMTFLFEGVSNLNGTREFYSFDRHDVNDHPKLIIELDTSVSTNDKKKKNGGGGCNDCTPPTIGVNKDGVRMVENGLILNGEIFNVNNFKDPMPMQYTEIGKENHLQVKIFENSGAYAIEKIQFAIVKEIGSSINIFEPRLEIDIANFANDIENSALKGVELFDKEGIFAEYKVNVSLVDCMKTSNQECLKLDIYWTFAKVPEFNVLEINGWDDENNSFNNYFNDGITVTDPNYVKPTPPEPYKYICKDLPLEEIQVWTRLNCNFADYKLKIANDALLELLKNN